MLRPSALADWFNSFRRTSLTLFLATFAPSRVPDSPCVAHHKWTSAPASAYRASVPPAAMASSSGWANIAKTVLPSGTSRAAASLRIAHHTAHAIPSTSSRLPALSMTKLLRGLLAPAGICTAISWSASSAFNPRVSISRVRRLASGASTSTTRSKSAGSSASNNSGISLMTTRSPFASATASRSARRRPTAGWTIALSDTSASASAVTIPRKAGRSSVPSGRSTSSPNRSRIAWNTGEPGT